MQGTLGNMPSGLWMRTRIWMQKRSHWHNTDNKRIENLERKLQAPMDIFLVKDFCQNIATQIYWSFVDSPRNATIFATCLKGSVEGLNLTQKVIHDICLFGFHPAIGKTTHNAIGKHHQWILWGKKANS